MQESSMASKCSRHVHTYSRYPAKHTNISTYKHVCAGVHDMQKSSMASVP